MNTCEILLGKATCITTVQLLNSVFSFAIYCIKYSSFTQPLYSVTAFCRHHVRTPLMLYGKHSKCIVKTLTILFLIVYVGYLFSSLVVMEKPQVQSLSIVKIKVLYLLRNYD